MDTLERLERALEQGYLLHGSPHILTRLEPRQAHDEETESGNLVAVYATKNLTVALFKGLIHGKGESYRTGWTWRDSEKRLFGENIELGDGYVYILNPEKFQPSAEDDAESFSLVPATPIQVVEVTYQDLLDLQSEYGFTLDIR